MTQQYLDRNRRTVLRSLAGASLGSVAGCLSSDSGGSKSPATESSSSGTSGPLTRVAVEETTLVVELSADAEIDQVNLIQPDGELFGVREVATGVRQVTFEIGTTYEPGEYRVLALRGEESVAESYTEVQPEIQIQDVGLFRNNPDKPWDEVYGESQTGSLKNGEAFVTVKNTGNGPDEIVKLWFSGAVPNPVDDPRGNGIFEADAVRVPSGGTVDLFTDSFPFGSKVGDEGMGCSTGGSSGQFKVVLVSQVTGDKVAKAYSVEYTGSDNMQNCEITISET